MLTVTDSVFLRGVTWMRDSHGLFDYESRSITKKSMKTHTPGKIIRCNNEIEFVSPTRQLAESEAVPQVLLQIKNDNSKCAPIFNTKYR